MKDPSSDLPTTNCIPSHTQPRGFILLIGVWITPSEAWNCLPAKPVLTALLLCASSDRCFGIGMTANHLLENMSVQSIPTSLHHTMSKISWWKRSPRCSCANTLTITGKALSAFSCCQGNMQSTLPCREQHLLWAPKHQSSSTSSRYQAGSILPLSAT